MDRPVAISRRKPLVLAAGIAILVLAGIALAAPALRRWARADRVVDASTLRFGTVTRGDLLRDLSLQARVVASLSPTLFSPGQGIVTLRARAGTQVREGDVLAVVDSPELEAALDIGGAALGQILLGDFRLTSPEGDINEGGFLLALALFVVPDPVDGQPEFRHGGAFGRVAQLGIPGEIADEHDFVEIGHG